MPSEFFKNSGWKIRWKLNFNRKSKQVAYYLRKDFFDIIDRQCGTARYAACNRIEYR